MLKVVNKAGKPSWLNSVKDSFAGPEMEFLGKTLGGFLRGSAYGLSTTN